MQPLPLKWRIGICVTFLMIVIVTVVSAIAYIEFREALFAILDSKLKSDMNTVRFQLYEQEPIEEIKSEIKAILLTDKNIYNSGYKIWFENGDTFLSSSDPMTEVGLDISSLNLNTPQEPGEDSIIDITENEKAYRVIWAKYTDLNNDLRTQSPVYVAMYTRSDYAKHEIEEFLMVIIVLGGLVVWLSSMATAWILRWGLNPLNSISNLMDNISGKYFDEETLETPQVPQELSSFVRAWNHMLSRLSSAMKEQRRFTADASHELRTPMATIKSTLQLARSRDRSQEYYKNVIDHSLEDLERLNHLMNQLLELSNLDNMEKFHDIAEIDIQQLTLEVCENYSVIAKQQGHSLELKSCPAKIMGHARLFYQLLGNLIDNAIKYSPDESTISVLMDKRDRKLQITVHDEGGNISENERHLIFERFYRLDKARTRSSGGTGIGLSIAKEIAQKHGGDITVSSNPEEGTSFIIILPVEK